MDQTQVLQLRNVFSASYINLHIIRTAFPNLCERKKEQNFRVLKWVLPSLMNMLRCNIILNLSKIKLKQFSKSVISFIIIVFSSNLLLLTNVLDISFSILFSSMK